MLLGGDADVDDGGDLVGAVEHGVSFLGEDNEVSHCCRRAGGGCLVGESRCSVTFGAAFAMDGCFPVFVEVESMTKDPSERKVGVGEEEVKRDWHRWDSWEDRGSGFEGA
ncbi:hypothetical protein RHMOL_Rhmol11G0256300 [Rhododendron molle]|uniref:Uncharacterized protein n=1 Tax=Rhododendron molle TaxID=49168 RepID=A0ACC0LX77_RHOML|nr:hypothetical protein RHMOL_Rhmol11G0256300 [Rhododendron molle]